MDRHVEAWFTHLDALWKIRTGVGLIPMSRPTLRVHTAFRRSGGARLLIRCQPGSVRSTQHWIESASGVVYCALKNPGFVVYRIWGRAGTNPASQFAANSGDTREPMRWCSSAGSQEPPLLLRASLGSSTLLLCCGPCHASRRISARSAKRTGAAVQGQNMPPASLACGTGATLRQERSTAQSGRVSPVAWAMLQEQIGSHA